MDILKIFFIFVIAVVFTQSDTNLTYSKNIEMNYSEQEILDALDRASKNTAHKLDDKTYFYNFFMDLEDGYLNVANSKIHLFADKTDWVVVFETNGFHNNGSAQVHLLYIGNCVAYERTETEDRIDLSNFFVILLIEESEFRKIENNTGKGMEQYELITPEADSITVRNSKIKIEHDEAKYAEKSISFRDYDNPNHLVDFVSFVRYLSETESELMSAKETEIKSHFMKDIPQLMTIESFYQKSIHSQGNLPSSYETYQLIARILVTKDTSLWKPTLKPNNHWSNWVSGNL